MTTQTQRTTQEVARVLVDQCRQRQFIEVTQALYSPAIVSIEPVSEPGQPTEFKGIEAILQKSRQWLAEHDVHGVEVSDPLIADNEFAISFAFDVTRKANNEPMIIKEIAVYEVRDGKIVREQFFYSANV